MRLLLPRPEPTDTAPSLTAPPGPTVPATASATSQLDDAALFALYDPPDRTVPSLRMNFVTSVDGAVTVDGYSEGLSNDPDQRVFRLLREVCDALMVGAGTLRTEGYGALTLDQGRRSRRVARGLAPVPPLVVVSSSLDLSPDHPMFADAPVRPLLLTHAGSPADRRAALGTVADVLVHGDAAVDLAAGLADLAARGLTQVLSEGGPTLFGSLVAADLVDELCLTVSPLLTGAGADRIVTGYATPAVRPLRLAHLVEADGVLLTRYVRA
ncbi:MAG TPA: pyrimidine reductase family protein [Cryptosporangiaceae bacterium]|nr:pyrimidine reductase family protein [Cryptosporangiaceae bacterium]